MRDKTYITTLLIFLDIDLYMLSWLTQLLLLGHYDSY